VFTIKHSWLLAHISLHSNW